MFPAIGEGCTEEIVMDRIKERGPLADSEACLSKAAGDGADRCLVLGVDTRWSRYRNCIILFRQLNMKA